MWFNNSSSAAVFSESRPKLKRSSLTVVPHAERILLRRVKKFFYLVVPYPGILEDEPSFVFSGGEKCSRCQLRLSDLQLHGNLLSLHLKNYKDSWVRGRLSWRFCHDSLPVTK